MVSESLIWFLTGVAQLLTSLVAIATLFGAIDKFIGGRLRNLIKIWLGIGDLQSSANRHDRKLDLLHAEHRTTIGIQNDLATAHNNLASALVESSIITDGGNDIFVETELIEEHAMEAGAEWPGSFLRGGGEMFEQSYPHFDDDE